MRILLPGCQLEKSRIWFTRTLVSGPLDKSRIWSCADFNQIVDLTDQEFEHAVLFGEVANLIDRIWECVNFCQAVSLSFREFKWCAHFSQVVNWQVENLQAHTLSGWQLVRLPTWQLENLIIFVGLPSLTDWEFDYAHIFAGCQLHGRSVASKGQLSSEVSFIHRDEAFRMQFGFRIFAQFCSGVCVIWKVNTTGRSSFIIEQSHLQLAARGRSWPIVTEGWTKPLASCCKGVILAHSKDMPSHGFGQPHLGVARSPS